MKRIALKLSKHILYMAIVGVLLAGVAKADKVTDWNAIGAQVALNVGQGGGTGNIILEYMHLPVYDAVNAIDGYKYTTFAVRPSNVPAGASPEAAAVEAAYRVLIALYPAQAAYLNAQYTVSLGSIPISPSKTDGIAVGAEVASLFLASRAGDGFNANVSYAPPVGPGFWVANSPGTIAAPWAAYMRPFAIESPDQFLPEPPPALDSDQWAADYNEVKLYGALNSTVRTPEQTTLGRFFLAPGVPQVADALRRLSSDKGLSLQENARLFAQVYASTGDANIAGWNSKLHYSFWRPITAIRHGDTDGRSDTEADPSWSPLAATPNHPEYLSAHAFSDGAYTEAISQFFGTKKLTIIMASSTTGTTMTFTNTDDIVKAVTDARIFAGFHYRTSCVRGGVLGMKVAKYVAKHYFLPVD